MSNGVVSTSNVNTAKIATTETTAALYSSKTDPKKVNPDIAGSTAMTQTGAALVACILSQPSVSSCVGVNLGAAPSFVGNPAQPSQQTPAAEAKTEDKGEEKEASGGMNITIGEPPEEKEKPKTDKTE